MSFVLIFCNLKNGIKLWKNTYIDIPSIWPYGAFLSPIIPTPNMALQYALTPNMQYAAMPFFTTQTIPNGTIASGNGNAQQQQQPNINSREPGKMTIQIGVQCVNQNNPININSMNDVGKINLQVEPPETGVKGEFRVFKRTGEARVFENSY